MANPLRRFAGDPTHPATVHFPLALYPATILFDILALTRSDGSTGMYTRAAFILIVAATVMALVAITTGFVQLLDVPADSVTWRLALIHMSVQLGAACILVVSLLTRLGHVDDARPPMVAIITVIVGTIVLLFGGWLGGHLVFTHGVSVERPPAPPDPQAQETDGPSQDPAGIKSNLTVLKNNHASDATPIADKRQATDTSGDGRVNRE